MNEKDKKVLEDILAKGLHELTDLDKAILRARRMYLNADQWEKYKEFLPADEVAHTDPEPTVTEPVLSETGEPAATDPATPAVTQPEVPEDHSADPDFVPNA